MARFWVYIGDKVQGPVDIPSLRKVPGFNLLTQVCQEGGETWRMADEVIEIKSYFLSPPRPNSFAMAAGNTAPQLDFAPAPEPSAKPILEELTLPEPNTTWQSTSQPVKKEGQTAPTGAAALRAVCEVCGYKNPRDVQVCMKCGEKLAGAAKAAGPAEAARPAITLAPAPNVASAPAPAPAPVAAAEPAPGSSAMVEIPLTKMIGGVAAAAVIAGGSFLGIRSWKKHHAPAPTPGQVALSDQYGQSLHPKGVGTPAIAIPTPAPHPTRATRSTRTTAAKHYNAAALPSQKGSDSTEQRRPPVGTVPNDRLDSSIPEPASYRVVAEATPLKKRFSSPINSPYATKRRADKTLWNSQEEQAIRQVQQTRIYGGQRTIGRNVEILMQILRDREYTTAFESGRRSYLYNDLDWGAAMKEGPLYEVQLTFSGGREADGSVKKPLHFAFNADLERGTVEPGGQDQIRSNTLHAFFDESRIPPEERRAIAKDAEELVMAAQPDASPLALDTVVRQFAKVYTTAALSRVADAYDLTQVKKRLAHDPRRGSDEPDASGILVQTPKPLPPAQTGAASAGTSGAKYAEKTQALTPLVVSKSGPAEFRMETGAGRERTFIVRAASKASPNRVWEILTGYDRLKQFVPDMLASEREGQDGAAIIVHTVVLTRFAFFVFKLNQHLRVIEHPREHALDFERIAGEFESFRGSVEVTTDPASHDTLIGFHATLVPSGHMMNWVLEKMARRLLVNQLEAIRAKAEANS